MRPICLYILAFYPVSTLISFALTSATPLQKNSQSSVHKARCLRFRENDVLRDMCPAFQQSDLDSFQALFPDVSILSGLGHDADFNLLYGSQPFYESDPQDGAAIQYDDQREPATSTDDNDAITMTTSGVHATQRRQQIPLESSSSSSSPPSMQYDTSSSVTKDGPLFSYKEWQQSHAPPKESDRRPVKKKTAGKSGLGGGQQMIDSVDGVFADDFGSMFEGASEGQRPAANVYNENEYIEPSRSAAPSKIADVPIKSLKEPFNYASIDCAATVRGANKEARGAQSILCESKDQYMLNKCSADKYVIINLCEEVLIDTIVLANFEFFSSTFKDFRVYVADRYPTDDWKFLGQWQARNTRDLQVFKVTNRIGWFDNIKIEFLTHYGHEYYCPLSLVRVHGMYMWEYYNLIESRGLSGDLDEDALMERYLWPSEVRDEIIHPKIDTVNDTTPMAESKEDDRNVQVPIIPPIPDDQVVQSIQHNEPPPSPPVVMPESTVAAIDPQASTESIAGTVYYPSAVVAEDPVTTEGLVILPAGPEPAGVEKETLPIILDPIANPAQEPEEQQQQQQQQIPVPHERTDTIVILDEATQSLVFDSASTTPVIIVDEQQRPSTTTPDTYTTSTFIGPMPTVSEAAAPPPPPPPPPIPGPDDVATRAIPIPKMPHKDGNTQESIYKTIMKRLNALEANATLSQRYLEEQNQIFNDVLRNMEKRHQDQLIALLGRLNDTASSRIDSMRRRYEQLYEELKYQSENQAREVTEKMALLADQIAFERRISMAQLVIVLTLFVFVALSRGTLSILSPIMEAQAQERKRRESADAQSLTAGMPSAHPLPPPAQETQKEISLSVPSMVSATSKAFPASPPPGEEDEERVEKTYRTRRSSSADRMNRLIRRWSDEDESISSPEPLPVPGSKNEHSDLGRRRRGSSTSDDATVPEVERDER